MVGADLDAHPEMEEARSSNWDSQLMRNRAKCTVEDAV